MRMCWEVAGRVQGVGFRAWTADRARALGLRGRVANLPDGSVVVEAEGEDGVIAEFEAALREGPRFARVSTITSVAASVDDLPLLFAVVKPWT